MKHFRLTQSALGQQLGVTKGYVSLMMNNKAPISASVIEGLIKSFAGLNIHWLLTNEGEMFLEKKEVEAGVLVGVMEPPPPVYERARRMALEDVAGIIESLQAEVAELRARVERLEAGCKEG